MDCSVFNNNNIVSEFRNHDNFNDNSSSDHGNDTDLNDINLGGSVVYEPSLTAGENPAGGFLDDEAQSALSHTPAFDSGPALPKTFPSLHSNHASIWKFGGTKKFFKGLPGHLLPLANDIRYLNHCDLVYIADFVESETTRDVYSLLPYTGSNWFLPTMRDCHDTERCWEVKYTWKEGLILACWGRRMSVRLHNIFLRVCFIILTWFMLWNILPHDLVLPGGYIWDPAVLVIVSALVGGVICRILQIPPLVGVLWFGIFWNNIPHLHYLTRGIVKPIFDIASKLGLTVILARAGFSLSFKAISRHWQRSILLATLPFACEAISHSLIVKEVFQYDTYNWPFLQGTLCSIVSPAVVVPGALYLQNLGYGRDSESLSLILSAVTIEIAIGVWCVNFILVLIFSTRMLAVAVVLGPVQLMGSELMGGAIGVLYYTVELIKEAQRLPNGKYAKSHFRSSMNFAYLIFLFICCTMVFLSYGIDLASGGCTMCLVFAATVEYLWVRNSNGELESQKKHIGTSLTSTWDQVVMPALFALVGSKIDVTEIFNREFFPKAVVMLVCSTAVRVAAIFMVQLGSSTPWREKLLVCIGYVGKATTQASMGPLAAAMVLNLSDDGTYDVAKWKRYANNVQQVSAMYVMFMAGIASLGLVRGGLVLNREVPEEPLSCHITIKRSLPTRADRLHEASGKERELKIPITAALTH